MSTSLDDVTTSSNPVISALFWNVRALVREAPHGDGWLFHQALTLQPIRNAPLASGEIPVWSGRPVELAARGLAAENANRTEEAIDLYKQLQRSNDPAASLLGWFLLCWSDGGDAIDAHEFYGLVVESFDDAQVQSLLLFKLLGILWSRRRYNDVDELSKSVRAVARKAGAPFLDRFTTFGFNELQHSWEQREASSGNDLPLLLDAPWVYGAKADQWTASTHRQFETVTDQPWTNRQRFGRTPVGDLLALEQQVVWAGRIWEISATRRVVGEQLLMGHDGPSTESFWYALTNYVAARGSRIAEAVALAEPRVREAGPSIWQGLRGVVPDWQQEAQLRVAAATWDLLDDTAANTALSTLPAGSGDLTTFSATPYDDALFSLGRRDLTGLFVQLGRLPADERNALLNRSVPTYRSSFSTDQRTTFDAWMFEAVRSHLDGAPSDVLLAEICRRQSGWLALVQTQVNLPDWLAASAGEEADEAVGDQLSLWLAERFRRLSEAVDAILSDGRRGIVVGFSQSPIDAYARVAARLGSETAHVALVSLVHWYDSADPLNRADLLRAIHTLCTKIDISGEDVQAQIASLTIDDDTVDYPLFRSVRPDELRVLRAGASILGGNVAELPVLLSGVRDNAPRIRLLALSDIGGALQRASHLLRGEDRNIAEMTLYSSLFDPEDAVLRFALSIVRPEWVWGPAQLGLYRARIREVFETRTRFTRAAAIGAARRLDPSNEDPATEALVAKAAKDPSWLVRTTAVE